MNMERSDEARREDSLYDRIGSLERERTKLLKRIADFETEIQEVSNQLMELYDKCGDTTEPEIYGTVLGLHERLEKFLPAK